MRGHKKTSASSAIQPFVLPTDVEYPLGGAVQRWLEVLHGALHLHVLEFLHQFFPLHTCLQEEDHYCCCCRHVPTSFWPARAENDYGESFASDHARQKNSLFAVLLVAVEAGCLVQGAVVGKVHLHRMCELLQRKDLQVRIARGGTFSDRKRSQSRKRGWEKPSEELYLKLAASSMHRFFLVKHFFCAVRFFVGLFTTAFETHGRESSAFLLNEFRRKFRPMHFV